MTEKILNSDLCTLEYEVEASYGDTTPVCSMKDFEKADWEKEFDKQRKNIIDMVGKLDRYNALAVTATQCLVVTWLSQLDSQSLKFPILELLQSILLLSKDEERNEILTKTDLENLWSGGDRLLDAFASKQLQKEDISDDLSQELGYQVKLHTLYYRFNFDRDTCLMLVERISKKFDMSTHQKYQLADRYNSLVKLLDQCMIRYHEYVKHVKAIQRATTKSQVASSFEFIMCKSKLAQHEWSNFNQTNSTFCKYKSFAIWLAFATQEWIYTFNGKDLSELDKGTLDLLSMKPGELAQNNFEHLFLNNPVWAKPFIRRQDGSYFAGQPQMAFSFPFRILCALISNKDDDLTLAFSKSKATALEELVFETVSEAIPSARVYRKVVWNDPESGKPYENDVVAILGNQIFIFEAKSGKIPDSARWGATLTLEKNLENLFVHPAKQSENLQLYLNNNPSDFRLYSKHSKEEIMLDLSAPKAVHGFSVIVEGFASITAGRRYFEGLNRFQEKGCPWTPTFSISELRMISTYLDCEISFAHYLTQRCSVERVLSNDRDEQDILSIYLRNGFRISGAKSIRDSVHNTDQLVRTNKKPRSNRENADVVGVQLSGFWKQIVKEFYFGKLEKDRFRFDILFTILNQPQRTLNELEDCVKKWKRGAGGSSKSGKYSKYVDFDRQYIVILNLFDSKKTPTENEIIASCRVLITKTEVNFLGATDYLVLAFDRRSKPITPHDQIQFIRTKTIKSTGIDPKGPII